MAGGAHARLHGMFEIRDFEYEAACPHCVQVLGIRTPLRGTIPEPGWVNLCRECGGLGIFERNGATLIMRKATDEEIAEAMRIPGLRLAREEAIADAARREQNG